MDLTVNYVIVLPEEGVEDVTHFQGFSYALTECCHIVYRVAYLPAHALELFLSRDNAIAYRINNVACYNLIPLEISALPYLAVIPELPLYCVFSTKRTAIQTKQIIKSFKQPVLHVSESDVDGAIPFFKLSRNHIYEYVLEVVKHFRSNNDDERAREIETNIGVLSQWKPKNFNVSLRGHNCITPNSIILDSFGYISKFAGPLSGTTNKRYVSAITTSVDAVYRLRREVTAKYVMRNFPPGASLILTAPSNYRSLYKNKPRKESIAATDDPKSVMKAYRSITTQRLYPQVHGTMEEMEKLFKSQYAQSLLAVRKAELDLYTAVITLFSCEQIAPVLRLPPSINLMSSLKMLGDCARGNSCHKHFKMNKMMRRLTSELKDIVSVDFISRIDRSTHPHIKIISDAPIELLNIRNIPLSLRYYTSHIPTTPGNLFVQQILTHRKHLVDIAVFSEILIIRSFSEDDSIRNHLVDSVNSTLGTNSTIRVKIIDVSSVDEFIYALNDYSGAVVIFDGHASHSNDPDIGGLMIGEEFVDVRLLRGIVRMPPIVILSACDTHPFDRSHASAANGFIILGAVTVLATSLPIDAKYAASFISRLCLRISEYIPAVTQKANIPLRWDVVVAGLLRMSFVSEMMMALRQWGRIAISWPDFQRIQLAANMSINGGDVNWYEKTMNEMSLVLNLSVDVLKREQSKWASITESMKYVQMGRPEDILISNGRLSQVNEVRHDNTKHLG